MQKEIRNSVSLVGNISSIGEVKENINGRKYMFFDICQNNIYKSENGDDIEEKEYFSFKLYPKELDKFKDIIEKGKWVHIIGYIHSYLDNNKVKHTYMVVNNIRELSSKNEKIPDDIFDYDWLNDEDES